MNTTNTDLFELLTERGFVQQCTNEVALREKLAQGPLTAYLGFDATADSLHVGHMQGLMLMRWLQKAGHRPLLLVGGATTRIGDPSFRDSSRPMLSAGAIEDNIRGISQVFPRFVAIGTPSASSAKVVDNAEWLDGLGFLNFLSEVGRHFTVNRLLALDAIKSRLEHSLSVQEFGYTLLQAFDFLELARREGCTLQIGGADQWANIINGIDLAHKHEVHGLMGLTMPLLATADGKKMGKSAGGAVWLNADKLSPFDFWQFWRNTDDRDVGRFLALFTELPMDEVRRLGALQGAELNEAKAILATHVTALVHGQDAAQASRAAATGVFGQGQSAQGLPELALSAQELQQLTLVDICVRAGLQPSMSAARRLADEGGMRLDGQKCDRAAKVPAGGHAAGKGWVLSAGKKRHVRVVTAA